MVENHLHNGLIVIEKDQCRIKLNKLTHIGTNILELSEILIYDFHYNYYITNKNSAKDKLLFIETDSLMYENETENVDKGFYKDK